MIPGLAIAMAAVAALVQVGPVVGLAAVAVAAWLAVEYLDEMAV